MVAADGWSLVQARKLSEKKCQPEGWHATIMQQSFLLLFGESEDKIDQLIDIGIGNTG
jgi:hypothetical protein